MDNPYTNNPTERGPEVYVKPVLAKDFQDEAWQRFKQIMEADTEIIEAIKRLKDK
jgi:hypothetical protein